MKTASTIGGLTFTYRDNREGNSVQIESREMRIPDSIFGLTIPRGGSGESLWYRNVVQTNWKETTGLIFDLEWKGATKLAFLGRSTRPTKHRIPLSYNKPRLEQRWLFAC